MVLSLADALHHMVDLMPWREESHKLDVHEAITTALPPDEAGAHSGAESSSDATAVATGTGTAGKADKA